MSEDENYRCHGTELKTLEELESYTKSRYKTLYKKEDKKGKCPNCGCKLEETSKTEYLTE